MLTTAYECQEAARVLGTAMEELRQEPDRLEGDNPVARYYEEMYRSFRGIGREQRENINLGQVFETFVPDGRSVLRHLRHRGSYETTAFESVNTLHFKNVTRSLLMAETMESLEAPQYIGWDLVTKKKTQFPYEEIMRGVGKLGNEAVKTGEDKPYARIGLKEHKVTLPETEKDGFIIEITQELSDLDVTGQVLERARSGSDSMAITLEREILSHAFGLINTYRYNDRPVEATYMSDHPSSFGGVEDNIVTSNALANWTDVDAAMAVWDLLKDPINGEPINISGAMDLIVPRQLLTTALNLLEPAWLQLGGRTAAVGDGTTGDATVGVWQTKAQPANNGRGNTFTLKCNQYVNTLSGGSTWYLGQFKKAFVYREYWPVAVSTMPEGYGWDRDLAFAFKINRHGTVGCKEWRYVVQNTA